MTIELYWLTLTIIMTAILWVPYVLNRLVVRGLFGALKLSDPTSTPHSEWAERGIRAHKNAVENLVIFAPLVVIAHLTGVSTILTIWAAQIFFFARLTHYLITVAGIPVLRTLAFATGFMCQLTFAGAVLGWI